MRPVQRIVVTLLIGLSSFSVNADEQAQIDFANGLFARGFYEDAAQEYRAYLDEYATGPHRGTAAYRLGESESAEGRYTAALEAFEIAVSESTTAADRARSALRRGVTLYNLGRTEDAARSLRLFAEEGSDVDLRAEAYYYLGKAHFDDERYADAADAFARVPEVAPTGGLATYARYQLAFVYIAQGKFENAAVQFSEVANSTSGEESLLVESRFRAAEMYDKIGWFDAAVKSYRQLQDRYPGSEYAERASYGYAWALYHAGMYGEAIAAAREFLATEADSERSPAVEYLQGNCFQQQQKFDDALGVYARIRDHYPGSEFARRAQFKSAWCLHAKNDIDGALRELDGFLGTGDVLGLTGDAVFLRATIFAKLGDYELAHRDFDRIVQEFPDSEFASDSVYKAAECLALLGRGIESAALFARFAEDNPSSPLAAEALLRAGDGDFAARKYESAAEKYTRMLALDSGPKEEGRYRLAVTYHNMGNFGGSADEFLRLLKDFPDSRYAAEANLRIGDVYLRDAGDAVRSMQYYEAALNANATGTLAGLAMQGLALARFESKDFDGAADAFLRVIEEHSGVVLNEETYAWTGDHLFAAEKWDAAARAYRALLNNVQDYPYPERIHFKIADAAREKGDAEAAVASYKAVVAAAPKSALASEATYRMAGSLEEAGRAEEAIALYEEAANHNTGEAAAQSRFRLGELSEERGEFEVAARHYMRVAILFLHETLSPESLYRAAHCFERSGNDAQARKTYGEVISEYPDSEQSALARERLAAM